MAAYFGPADVFPHCGEYTRDAIIRILAEGICKNGATPHCTPEEAANAVLAREAADSTVVSDGLALPHARFDGLPGPRVAVATSERGVDWPGADKPVHVVVMIFIPRERPAEYLKILRAVTSLFQDPDALETLAAMTNSGDIYRFFKDGQAFMPRYITAADVMKREVPVLPESGTIQDCIDAFIREKTSEIAVVDVEGRLKGVARADRLLEICLPEYMHWMGDISPVLDFEPFAQILQNEHVTPLVRIMSDEVPVVAPDAPAVQVSYAMMRSKSPRCYVCRDGKLAGAVKLVDFLNKVFRE